MSLPKMETDVRNIEKLDKRPNATNGIDYKKLQKAFDKAGVDIQSFLNNTLIPALDSGIGGVDINALQEAQGADKEMAFPVYDPRVGVNAKLLIADILPFTVAVTKAADGTMTSDKTFAQVRSAFNAGRPVFCVYTNNKEQWFPVILTLAECSINHAVFTRYTEVYQGDTRLVWITLSASGALDATSEIDASSIAYSNTTDEESKLAADVKAFLDLLYQKLTGLSASDVSYSGDIGEFKPKNVSAALEALMNYTDDKVGDIPVTKDATADYAESGASSVQAWATMAKTGSTTQYRVAAGEYHVTDAGDVYTVRIVDSTYTSWSVRRVSIAVGDDEANAYVDVYTCNAPGTQIHHVLGVGSDDGAIVIGGKRYPMATSPETAGNILTAAKNAAGVVVPQWAAKPAYKADEIKATVPYGDETGSAKNVQYALDMLAANLAKVNVPTVTASDNGAFLRVVNGAWAKVQLTNVAEVGA
nr:MAG TPA: hypothetical protein [Caudoviricetes sp.]